MAPPPTLDFDPCLVCGDTGHPYRKHLEEVAVPSFVGQAVRRLRALEMSGSHIDGLVEEVRVLADEESGGRRAWVHWLLELLEELEEVADAPDVAAQIEEYLVGGFAG